MTTETTTPAAPTHAEHGKAMTAPAPEGIAPAAPVGNAPPAPQPVTIVETPKPSLDEELSALYDKINAPKEDAKQPATNKVAAALASQSNDEPELPLEADKDITDPPKTEAKEPEKSSQGTSMAIPVPQSWSADVKQKWSSLPPDVQTYIAGREKEAHSKITQQGNELRSYQPVREIYDWIRTQGVPTGKEPEVVANWARAQAALDANPVEGLKWLANSYKVDLSKLAGAAPQGKAESEAIDDLFRDPRYDKIAPEVSELRNQISLLQRQLHAQANADNSVRQRQVETIIETFSADKQDWADLENDIVNEIEVLKSQDPALPYDKLLEKAYDRARWANPDIRARILSEDQQRKERETEAARKKEAEEAAKKAAQAKKVASMNMRTGASASTPAFDGKWDDKAKLGALYDRIQSGSR